MSLPYDGLNVFVEINGHQYLPADLNLQSLEVEDTDEGDSSIKLVCVDNDYKIVDSPSIKVGALVSVRWGYTGGKSSPERHNYVLMKPSVHYSEDGVITTLCAYTKSATLSARQPQKTYGATSVRQIVSEIANRSGLTLNIKGGNEKLNAFSTANWTDRQTLRVLADRFGYQVSFSSDSINFAPVDYGAAPSLTLLYNQGEDSNILSAELTVDARKPKGGDALTKAAAVDPNSKQVVTADSHPADKTLAISAEDGHSWITGTTSDAAKSLQSLLPNVFEVPPPAASPQDVIQNISTPDADNLGAIASGELLKKQKKKGELTINTVGILDGTARRIVHVKGLAKRDSGNWYVQDVIHKISQEGYNCEWNLSRHGNNTQGGKPDTALNKLTDTNDKNVTVPVAIVDAETGKVS